MVIVYAFPVLWNIAEVRTCVFWDIEDFQVPDGEDIDSIYQNINSALTNKGYQKFGMLEIRVYGEKYKIWDELILAGIMVVPVGSFVYFNSLFFLT